MGNRKNILIVDDEVNNRRLLEAYLTPLEYNIVSFESGDKVLEYISCNEVDLVLLDIMMPGENGFEVCREIKKRKRSIQVILVTSMIDLENKVIGLGAGADDFLAKPVHEEELIARVKAHLRIKDMVDEIEDWNKKLEEKVTQRTQTIQEMNQQLSDSYHVTMDSLISALDVREHETSRHSLRVAFQTVEMARAWGIASQELEEIATGALLHDVGKIGISDNILLKPGKLTDEEWVEVRKHVEISWKIVKAIEFMGKGRELVYAHHERFDGKGYPRGLKNEEIYIGARFFAIADTLDAMTNDRPYRKALSYEFFLEELKRCSGAQFDPQVVKVFLSLPRERWLQIAHQADFVDFNKLITAIHIKPAC